MPLAEDQHVIQPPTAQRACEPSRAGTRPRRPDWGLDHPRAIAGEDLAEGRGESAVPAADQEREPPGAPAEAHQQVPALPGRPRPDWMSGHPRMCTARVRTSITN